jgi:DNA-binding ferritin-like protein (Dps family)
VFVSKMIGEKRRWWRYKARTAQLPPDYRAAIGALERYLMRSGPGDGESVLSMHEDLADLFEQSAADGIPIRAVVGRDAAEFAEAFARNYPGERWIDRERARLAAAIDRAERDER